MSRIPARCWPLLLVFATPAYAHEDVVRSSGFLSGFLHPLTGPDHLVAMLAVGLWGAFLGRRAMVLLPLVFPLVMAAGAALGMVGVPLPAVEVTIAVSALVLGLAVAASLNPPVWLAAMLVGLFAVFHGHAHGTELPHAAHPLDYGIGFVIATSLLHAGGIGLGLLARWPAGRLSVRAMGAAISLAGCAFLLRAA
jgi:urease accessory protein